MRRRASLPRRVRPGASRMERIHGRAAAAPPSVSFPVTLRQKRLFGYIVINEHDLSAEEKARYLQVYCGLCRSLQRRFGERARLLLNNDLVFMALLHLSLYEPAETVEQGTCVMHPIKDRTWAVSACTEYAADMTVLLSYYKSLDDCNDDRRRSARLINRMLARPLAQVRERWPRQADALARCLDAVGEVEGRRLRSVAKGDVDLSGIGADAEDKADEPDAEEFTDLLAWLGEELEDQVKQVRLSHRLTESAACMVGDEFDMTPQLEAMYRASGMEMPTSKRILELNPSHPLVQRLRAQHAEDASAAGLAESAKLLAGAAVLAEGGALADPAAFAKLLVDRI